MENLTLRDAIFKMAVGDRFELCAGEYIEKVTERTFVWNGGEELSFTQFWTYKNNKGQIIPAKKEMVSAEKVVMKFLPEYFKRYGIECPLSSDILLDLAQDSAENRDILYADLMEMISELMSMFKNMFATADTEIRVKNIKAELDKIDIAINPDHRPAGSTSAG